MVHVLLATGWLVRLHVVFSYYLLPYFFPGRSLPVAVVAARGAVAPKMSVAIPLAESDQPSPWYQTAEVLDESPSRAYFVRKYGSVERARSREQEYRQQTCAFLQETGQKLRLYAALRAPSQRWPRRSAATPTSPVAQRHCRR